ncbi:MAG: aminodeoxychorismate/anthranilate synthase component II [Rickettsiales bacterium]|jgi:anthranilate synthase component 2|nr:aminodeoxychorismate/anthranilate synthase component II [Rickettsiales bacterium]
MKILLLDNYDSFTYNLVHYIGELGAEVAVYRNDQISVVDILKMKPDGIVISPGPGNPQESGICLDLIKQASGKIPILGVCLGHQAIGEAFGGKVIRAPKPMHGKVSAIYHEGTSVFKDLPIPFNATRYHSLIVDRASLPDCLEVTAVTSDDGLIMGLAHKTHNTHGVQFHPESIASEYGHELIRNFLSLLSS